VVTLVAHGLLYLGILTWLLGPWSALLVILLHKAAGGFYLATVFAPNHKGMLEVDEDSDLDFLRSQVLTSRNVRASWLTDFWYGSLNYQVEHHLFPSMARNNVSRAHSIVRQYCAEIGVAYHETSLLQSYRELLGFLHEVGAPLRRRSPVPASEEGSRPAPASAPPLRQAEGGTGSAAVAASQVRSYASDAPLSASSTQPRTAGREAREQVETAEWSSR
jgi:fatty acid desaturase